MRFLLLAPFLASLVATIAVPRSEYVSYHGYKVFRVRTQEKLESVQRKLSLLSLEEWNHDIKEHIDVVVPPHQLAAFQALGLDCHTMHENLGDSIIKESGPNILGKRQAANSSWFDSYHDYNDHVQYFSDLHDSFLDNSEIISSGTSVEGRDIYGLHLWGAGGPGKPAVLYHATVHAREWIAAPVVEYVTTQLIDGYQSGNNDTRSFLDRYDFYILPFVNPDGFVYSQTTNRLWRKNRQPPPAGANSTCFGRDINRNWEFAWDATPRGASTNPCSETYKGEAPSDTPENQGLDTFVRKLRDLPGGIKLFIDFHSYGQDILSPYGFNETLYAPELGKWTAAASLVSQTIRESSSLGTTFTFGPSGATLYATTGAAPDHVYSIGGAEFSYTIELPDTGDFGFVLPPERIRGAVEEQWTGQQVLLSLLDETFFDGEGPA